MRVALAGIDPGIHGAVAIVHPDNNEADLWLLSEFMDNPTQFKKVIDIHEVKHIYIEKAQSMPFNGGVTMLNYGTGFGRIIGWIEMLQIPYTMIRPQIWTKEMHRGVGGDDAKTKSEIAARRLFPTENLCLPGKKKMHSGMMDARLIAEYGKRVHK